MRPKGLGLVLAGAMLLPTLSSAQATQIGSPQPQVNAATASWQTGNEAIVVGGLVYYPTRAIRMFDSSVMSQVGLFDSVPVYADVTVEPFTIVYVPVARDRMRAYTHARTADTIATSPSREATITVQTPRVPTTAEVASTGTIAVPMATPPVVPQAVGTTGSFVTRPAARPVSGSGSVMMISPRTGARTSALDSIPRARGLSGLWLDYSGTRWYQAGASTSYTPDRFIPVGEYHGFTVYQDRNDATTIWVPAVKDGPIAPYRKR